MAFIGKTGLSEVVEKKIEIVLRETGLIDNWAARFGISPSSSSGSRLHCMFHFTP